jgi:hypothetical protein
MHSILALVLPVGLAACAAAPRRIVVDDGLAKPVGSITDENRLHARMEVEIGDKRVDSSKDFLVHRTQDHSVLRQRYGTDSKHYQAIFSGLDPNHYFYFAQPALIAEDGRTARCVLAWKPGQLPRLAGEADDGQRAVIRVT